jgi:hypothetical protein
MANLTTPAFLVDVNGALVFFNEAAGHLLGLTYGEAGPMPPQEWGTRFEPSDVDGSEIPVDQLPLSIALNEGRPAFREMRIQSVAGDSWTIDVTAFPVVGRAGQTGALAIFWSVPT